MSQKRLPYYGSYSQRSAIFVGKTNILATNLTFNFTPPPNAQKIRELQKKKFTL